MLLRIIFFTLMLFICCHAVRIRQPHEGMEADEMKENEGEIGRTQLVASYVLLDSEIEDFFTRELLEAPAEVAKPNITIEEIGHGVGCSGSYC